jgi:anti-sigma factor RsiW
MVNESAHPEQLFEYLNDSTDTETAQAMLTHLSVCEDCASVVAVVRALKGTASGSYSDTDSIPDTKSQLSHLNAEHPDAHPDLSELASFFYAEPGHEGRSRVAMHVALCDSCVNEIAEYARAERAATEYRHEKIRETQPPAKAWELIRDWEESSFAAPKSASEVLGQEMLNRLFKLIDEGGQHVPEIDRTAPESQGESRVPVLVVSNSGEVRSVELFKSLVDAAGIPVLKHAEGSQRFDNRVVHALLDYGEKDPVVISELIKSGTLRLQPAAREEKALRRVDYFIIEEGRD